MPLINILPVSYNKVSMDFKLKRFMSGIEFSPEDAHATRRMIFDKEARKELLSPVINYPGAKTDVIDLYRNIFSRPNTKNPLNRMLYVDLRFYLPNDMLVKLDRITMANGIEAREPFLDYRLVEFLASVPAQLKLNNLHRKKHLLKVAMKTRLPHKIIRRKKQGLNLPNAAWIKNKFRPFVSEHLSSERIKEMGILEHKYVDLVLREHFSGKKDNSHQIWCLLTLSLWWKQFIGKNRVFY